jgi:hypothetical protein
MALPSAIKLFINPRTGLAFGNFNGTSQITNPTVTLGDTARFEIYLVEDTGINTYPRQEIQWPGTPGIKIAVGPIDESPQAGTWKVSFGGDTTAALAYNVTATALAAALNGLASITSAGGVTVSKIGDNYNIVFNQNGARGDILTDGAALIPLSNATVAKLQIGDSTRPQIALVHLQRTIAGLATSFTATAASTIAVESLSAWDGSRATYRASIAPDPKGGSFALAFDAATGTDVSSASIAVGASAIDVQNALNLGALADKVSVSQIGAYSYDITVTAQPGTGGLTANGAGLISFNGYVGELSLNTAEAISLLDGAEEVSTNLEVEVTSEGKALTVLQIPCTLKNAVIDPGSIQPLVLDSYLSQAAADGRYARQANNLSDLASISQARTNLGVYSTSSVDTALALKASLAGANFSGEIVTPTLGNILNTDLVIDSYNDTGAGTHYYHKFTPFDGKFVLAPNGGGLAFPDGTTQTTAFTGSVSTAWGTISGSLSSQVDLTNALAGKAASVHTHIIGDVTGLQTALDGKAATSHSQAISTITGLQTALDAKANLSGATFTGKINTTTTAAGAINFQPGVTPASPANGDVWMGQNALFIRGIDGQNRAMATLSATQTFAAPQIIDTTATTPGLRITQKGAGSALVVEDSTTPDSDALIVDANGNLGIGVSNNPGNIWTGTTNKLEVNGNTQVSGLLKATFMEVGSSVDYGILVWGGINFQDFTTGSGSAFPTGTLTVGGFSTQANPNTNGNLQYNDYPIEIVIKLAGGFYAVPARVITIN